jgi:hypothetical protein
MHQVVWGPCPACKGTGKPIADVGGACGGCEGKGWAIGHLVDDQGYGLTPWAYLAHPEDYEFRAGPPRKPTPEQEEAWRNVLSRPVADVYMPVRVRNMLERLRIHTFGDLVAKTEVDLVTVKNFGYGSLGQLKKILAELGLALAPNRPCAKSEE